MGLYLLLGLRELKKKKDLVAVAILTLSEVTCLSKVCEFQNIWSLFLPKGVCSFYHVALDG